MAMIAETIAESSVSAGMSRINELSIFSFCTETA